MRLFVALDLPDEVELALEVRVRAAKALGAPLRWVVAQQWHITLAFYGEVDESKVDDLTQRLARAARRRHPFAVSIADPGRFGSARRARVVWLGLDEGVEPLESLAASARAAGRRVGLRRDDLAADFRYRPHITVARVVPSTDVQDVLEALRSPEHPRWTAHEALLVRSEPGGGQGGRVVHSVLARLPFGAPAAPHAG